MSKKVVKHTTETFQKVLEEKVGTEYRIVGEYKDYRTHITVFHEGCGSTYEVKPSRVTQGRRCPHCHSNHRKNTAWYKEKVYELEENEYKVLSEYVNYRTPVEMKHERCGHEFQSRPAHFLNNRRCPKCRLSKGEQLVEKTLKQFNLQHQMQVKFNDCRHIQQLPFDFGVYTLEGSLLALIEFDGEQHFKAVKAFGDKKDFYRRLRNDRIKNNYTKANGIPLLRIPHFEKRPKTKLMKFLVNELMQQHDFMPQLKKEHG